MNDQQERYRIARLSDAELYCESLDAMDEYDDESFALLEENIRAREIFGAWNPYPSGSPASNAIEAKALRLSERSKS